MHVLTILCSFAFFWREKMAPGSGVQAEGLSLETGARPFPRASSASLLALRETKQHKQLGPPTAKRHQREDMFISALAFHMKGRVAAPCWLDQIRQRERVLWLDLCCVYGRMIQRTSESIKIKAIFTDFANYWYQKVEKNILSKALSKLSNSLLKKFQ